MFRIKARRSVPKKEMKANRDSQQQLFYTSCIITAFEFLKQVFFYFSVKLI